MSDIQITPCPRPGYLACYARTSEGLRVLLHEHPEPAPFRVSLPYVAELTREDAGVLATVVRGEGLHVGVEASLALQAPFAPPVPVVPSKTFRGWDVASGPDKPAYVGVTVSRDGVTRGSWRVLDCDYDAEALRELMERELARERDTDEWRKLYQAEFPTPTVDEDVEALREALAHVGISGRGVTGAMRRNWREALERVSSRLGVRPRD